ncbi:hypothetical protein [Yinghuangia soli]|uniref:Uncharacterized protein n=1 Tax=Yinghuangia soli TaxID=2908204 RepID=A0AA41PXN9_9ACTN|nr:hypothetical protein [Yinghuangia soli]MCF2526749.1 hypothetical protein [Yinghuangia soli]
MDDHDEQEGPRAAEVPAVPPLPEVTVPTRLRTYGQPDEKPLTAPMDAAQHWDARLWSPA